MATVSQHRQNSSQGCSHLNGPVGVFRRQLHHNVREYSWKAEMFLLDHNTVYFYSPISLYKWTFVLLKHAKDSANSCSRLIWKSPWENCKYMSSEATEYPIGRFNYIWHFCYPFSDRLEWPVCMLKCVLCPGWVRCLTPLCWSIFWAVCPVLPRWLRSACTTERRGCPSIWFTTVWRKTW